MNLEFRRDQTDGLNFMLRIIEKSGFWRDFWIK